MALYPLACPYICLTIIVRRVLKNDFSRNMEFDDESMDEEEVIHGDVLFCAAVGIGRQLLVSTFFIILLVLCRIISARGRGSILAGIVIIYSLTSLVGGFVSTKLYFQMNGKSWAHCVLLTAILFPLPVVIVFTCTNSIAIFYGSTSVLPFDVIISIISLYVFISAPLTLLGGLLAKNFGTKYMKVPTRITRVSREILTEVPWYKGRFAQMLISGFLQFSVIYIVLDHIFIVMWETHQDYTLFDTLCYTFILLTVVTSSITVSLYSLNCFQLSPEGHRWWRVSFVNGGLIAFITYAYSFYFYFHRSGMSRMLQTFFYFGYMSIISFGIFLMLGSVSFQMSLLFVKDTYGRIKKDGVAEEDIDPKGLLENDYSLITEIAPITIKPRDQNEERTLTGS